MPVKDSGQLDITEIVAEFGGSTPHALNEYYRGGANVPDVTINNSIPVSGQIQMNNFYSAANIEALSYNGSANTVTSEYYTIWNSSSATITVDVTGNRAVKSAEIRTDQGTGGSDYGTTMGIKLTGENVQGASGNLTRGSITEIGPITTNSTSTCSTCNHGVNNYEVPTDKFLVGIKFDGGGGSENDDNAVRIRSRGWVRYATFTGSAGAATWTGSQTLNSTITTEPNDGHPNPGDPHVSPGTSGDETVPSLSSGTICTGMRFGTGYAGEWTDNSWYNEFELGLISRASQG